MSLCHEDLKGTGKSRRRKGQVLLEDFIMSLVIFGVIFSATFFAYYSIQQSRAWKIETTYLWERAMNTLDYLITSPGVPENWNATNVRKIGLAVSDHVVSADKILEMKKMNYTTLQTIMGVGVYNFFLVAESTNGTVITVNSTPLDVGLRPTESYEFLLRADRYAYCQIEKVGEREICRIELILWM